MKTWFLIGSALLSSVTYGQRVKELFPELGYEVQRSPEDEVSFITKRERCEELWRKSSSTRTSAENAQIDRCMEDPQLDYEDYYAIPVGPGCSWYCGGGMDTLSATSELPLYKRLSYAAKNAHDLSYRTAWIEGVPGYGIGESLTYHFPPENPRITKLIVVNGYVRSESSWRDNSRVKKLRLYLDGRPFAMLNLVDSRQEQSFSFEPLGYSDRVDGDRLRRQPWWTMKFEIVEVYPGDKYDGTAITEIYFDGIDVH